MDRVEAVEKTKTKTRRPPSLSFLRATYKTKHLRLYRYRIPPTTIEGMAVGHAEML